MLIWSWQSSECADTLERGETWHCDATKASWYGDFDYYYDWMASEMARRIGKPPAGVRWPIWGWARYDFIDGNCPEDDDPMVDPSLEGDYACLLMDVPDSQVLLSDEEEWMSILNGYPVLPVESSYITDEDELTKLIDRFIDMKKDVSADAPTDEILATWPTVFDTREIRSPLNNWHGRHIQATFWEIRPEWVVRVRRFHVTPHKSKYDVAYDDAKGNEDPGE